MLRSSKRAPRAGPKKAASVAQAGSKRAAAPKSERPTARPAAEPANPSAYAVGDRIVHRQFGNGIVRAVDGDTLTIEFARKVVKRIIDAYVKPRR